jgi:hypothetical protein
MHTNKIRSKSNNSINIKAQKFSLTKKEENFRFEFFSTTHKTEVKRKLFGLQKKRPQKILFAIFYTLKRGKRSELTKFPTERTQINFFPCSHKSQTSFVIVLDGKRGKKNLTSNPCRMKSFYCL